MDDEDEIETRLDGTARTVAMLTRSLRLLDHRLSALERKVAQIEALLGGPEEGA